MPLVHDVPHVAPEQDPDINTLAYGTAGISIGVPTPGLTGLTGSTTGFVGMPGKTGLMGLEKPSVLPVRERSLRMSISPEDSTGGLKVRHLCFPPARHNEECRSARACKGHRWHDSERL